MKCLLWFLIFIVTSCSASNSRVPPRDSGIVLSPQSTQTPTDGVESTLPANDHALEMTLATNIAARVNESPEEMLKLCDQLIKKVDRLQALKKMSRMDCLVRSNELMALSDEEPNERQRFKKDRNGKYSFQMVLKALEQVADEAANL